jgi:putative Ca2+/H+ antiporter (TMEM165/GDT1 family)
MFAGIACAQSVGVLIGNVIQNAIMEATTEINDGIVFYVDAGVYVSTAVLVM